MAAQLLTKAEDAESLDGDGSDRTNNAGAVRSGAPHRLFWGDWSGSKWLARRRFRTSAFPDFVKTRCNLCEAEQSSTRALESRPNQGWNARVRARRAGHAPQRL